MQPHHRLTTVSRHWEQHCSSCNKWSARPIAPCCCALYHQLKHAASSSPNNCLETLGAALQQLQQMVSPTHSSVLLCSVSSTQTCSLIIA
ncbi:hypothetical protein RRG08_055068 [Elysia crispata]|uniref:Uncharacterized protein n=1 Tax=Elysia crispata TaxID=231223 RepID=A0AAE1E7N9_9GAST|nr:hypothetical protein RRG08_055068 [Elysia crispata]